MSTKRIICVIPARLESTRFPRKILATLEGKPLLEWVWRAAVRTNRFDEILFAVDAPQTACAIQKFGGQSLMTSQDCASGTDRLIEVMESKLINSGRVKGDVWVNWQADEPFITTEMIDELLQTSSTGSACVNDASIWTLKKLITHEEALDQNIVKVVCDNHDNALYFSRSPIPFYRETPECEQVFYKHVGLYAYTTSALQKISNMPASQLEVAEKLEQLRFLQHGLSICVHTTKTEVIGIDTPQDLEKAVEFVQKQGLLISASQE
ncbi:3-deoxy-manno-octulosonate cytidylyltransferase [Candidatus Babeliales bacterium]|nr:3-deoxy-manno-octulosonate cytidylyltransferase [Candidatus Babeliales bacterium]